MDTLAVWSGMADENDASEATRSISLWTRLAQEYNACVLLVHHMRKGGGSNGEAIRGSSAILGTADGYWEVTRVSDAPTDTRRRVNVITRMSFPLTMTVSYDAETGHYAEVPKDAVAPTAEGWLDAIPEGGEGISVALLGTRWNIGRSTVQERLARLEADGLVRKDTVKVESSQPASLLARTVGVATIGDVPRRLQARRRGRVVRPLPTMPPGSSH